MDKERVLLLGDEVRLAYQPVVERVLAEGDLEVVVMGPSGSTGSSAELASAIESLLNEYRPTIVQFNAGLVDVQWHREERHHVVGIAEYELNLQRIVDACKPVVGGGLIFATTTNVVDDLQSDRPGQTYDRFNRDIEEYNIAACEIMLADDVLINRLDGVLDDCDGALAADGVSLAGPGAAAAAAATLECLHAIWHC